MARGKQSKGKCIYCNREMTRAGLSKHFQSCTKREQVLTTADAKGGKKETLYHLLVQDNWRGYYWLHLEMPESAILEDLDYYLREIWLECCDHLSEFLQGRRGEEIPMSTKIGRIFDQDIELLHIYDFGTSSETKIKCISTRRGKPTSPHPVTLMARNQLEEVYCTECKNIATRLCLECLEYEDEGTLCEEHAESHPHDDYGSPIAIVNSPRLGMCGYTGPATPPY